MNILRDLALHRGKKPPDAHPEPSPTEAEVKPS